MVAIDATDRAQAGAGVAAQRSQRELERQRVVHRRTEIDRVGGDREDLVLGRGSRPGFAYTSRKRATSWPCAGPRHRRHTARHGARTVRVTTIASDSDSRSASISSTEPSGTAASPTSISVARSSIEMWRRSPGWRSRSATGMTSPGSVVTTGPGRRTRLRARRQLPPRLPRARADPWARGARGPPAPYAAPCRARPRTARAAGRSSPRPRGAGAATRPRPRSTTWRARCSAARTTSVRCTIRSACARAASRMSSPSRRVLARNSSRSRSSHRAARSSSGSRLFASSRSSRISSRLIIADDESGIVFAEEMMSATRRSSASESLRRGTGCSPVSSSSWLVGHCPYFSCSRFATGGGHHRAHVAGRTAPCHAGTWMRGTSATTSTGGTRCARPRRRSSSAPSAARPRSRTPPAVP